MTLLNCLLHPPEIGTVKEEVDANDVEGGSLKISFNSKYMMDALKAIDNDEG